MTIRRGTSVRPPAKARPAPLSERPMPRKRMPVEDRRSQFLEAGIKLFAEHGFSANTRMLAERLGITQPLLFRYFPTKDALLQAVLQELYSRQSQTDWSLILRDRAKALRSRLIEFGMRYAAEVYDRDWIRIYMFAGLADGDFNRRYIADVTEPILRIVAEEIRREIAPAKAGTDRTIRQEIEYIWLFHGGLYYHAIRRHVYGIAIDADIFGDLVEISVDNLIDGMRRLYSRMDT